VLDWAPRRRGAFVLLIFHTLQQQVGMLMGFAGCGYALWRGGRPERIFGLVLLIAWTVSPFTINTNNWLDPQWAEAMIDLVVLAALLWLAFTSDRYWPMWCAAFHAVGVLMHVTMLVDRRVPPWSYRTASAIWSYVVLFTLVIGTMVEVHRPFRRPGSAG
jgi:hypothetical protein